jgi:hypothetical protein
MIVKNYNRFGGKHFESAALKNTFAHSGVLAPHTGEPFSEALCLGIAGGIAAGYSFCPSIPGHGVGSGVSVAGRYRVFTTDGSFYKDFFNRIGAKITVKESGGIKAAFNNMKEGLEAGKPVIVWCAPPPYHTSGWTCAYGMYTMVVYGIDEDKQEAYIGDRAPTPFTLSLNELSGLRNRVCSHKNRSLTFEPPKKVTADGLKKAIQGGIKACAQDFITPKLKSYSLPGLLEWSKVIANPKNKRGWPTVYPKGKMYLPLRDIFQSVETAGTGGGLYRLMYADFLEEAALITNRKALSACAETYRELGEMWTGFAEAFLPDGIKPFKETKKLLRKRAELFERKGTKARVQIDKLTADLRTLAVEMQRNFPLSSDETMDLLGGLSDKIATMHAAESEAAQMLKKAVN